MFCVAIPYTNHIPLLPVEDELPQHKLYMDMAMLRFYCCYLNPYSFESKIKVGA